MNLNFLRLHNAETNSVVIINAEMIGIIDTDTITPKDNPASPRTVSLIFMNKEVGVEEFMVNESPERIYDMINDLKKEMKNQ